MDSERRKIEALIKEVLAKNKEYSPEQIEFTSYCTGRMAKRGIMKEEVLSVLMSGKDLYYAKMQDRHFHEDIERRHKLIYKVSSRYSLIVIIAYYEKILKVINVIKTSKGAEKQWRKKISK